MPRIQDVFYPEFAKIRATGVLPTGQLVPADPLTGLSPAAFAMPQAASPYGHPSPAAAHAGMHQYGTPSPGAYAAHAAFSPPTMLSIPSPAGMAYPSPQQPWQQQPSPSPLAFGSPQVAAYGAAGQGGWGHPSPAVSMTPGQQYGAPSPAVPPARQQQQQQQPKLGADPFDGLGSVLGGALSSPAPQQAGNGFHAAVKPAPAVQMPATSQTAAASATLFGVNTAIGAYDLSAPAAPKAKATGNPFA